MRLLTWNIRHGGSKSRLPAIEGSIRRHHPDVIVLTEYRTLLGGFIKESLERQGLVYQVSSNPADRVNGLLIAAKMPISLSGIGYAVPRAIHRWLDVECIGKELRVIGIHIPGIHDKWDKQEFWESVLEFAKLHSDEKVLLIGDFNTGLAIDAEGTPFALSQYMANLNALGWVDAWRQLHHNQREYTWYSNKGAGFRLDYAYLSPALAHDLFAAFHSHEERLSGTSDHSALVIDIK